MTSTTLSPIRTTVSKQTSNTHTYYAEILKQVKEENLLQKTPKFYITRFIIISILSLTAWGSLAYFAISGQTPLLIGLSFPIAIILGILSAQYAFIAHEAAHNQVFHKNKTNEWVGRVMANLFAGLSYGFWIRKHTRHHGKPNQIGYDPDINIRVLSFTTESLENKKGAEKLLSKNQGWLFPILLFFTGFDLLLDSIVSVTQKNSPVKHRIVESVFMVIRQTVPFIAFLLITQNIFLSAGLWLVMMMSFGFFMGLAFAPNHKGMPLVPENAKLGYFERQVLTSRNIKSNWFTDNFMGGLNFQVEHHLFPSMSRPHLHRTHEIVAEFCKEKGMDITEMTIPQSFKTIIKYLNQVGLSNNVNPFNCPLVDTYKK